MSEANTDVFATQPIRRGPKPLIRYEAKRDIAPGEPKCYNDTPIKAGDRFFRFTGITYMGSPLKGNVWLSSWGPTEYPCFELPLEVLREVST